MSDKCIEFRSLSLFTITTIDVLDCPSNGTKLECICMSGLSSYAKRSSGTVAIWQSTMIIPVGVTKR